MAQHEDNPSRDDLDGAAEEPDDALEARGVAPRLRRPAHRAADFLVRTNASPGAVRAAQAARRLISDEPVRVSGDRTSARIARLISEAGAEKSSAVHELGLATVQIWQRLRARRGARSQQPVAATILFTDLVEFSSWALRVGDDQVLRLLAEVNEVTAGIVKRRGGTVVKHLGDGVMAVFVDGTEAIEAGYEAICAVSALTVDGYRPQLRAGLHTGTPRPVGDDYLGVDVNIAARVADAAGAGELLVSADTLAISESANYTRRRRRFKAKGVPRELEVFAVVPRYEE